MRLHVTWNRQPAYFEWNYSRIWLPTKSSSAWESRSKKKQKKSWVGQKIRSGTIRNVMPTAPAMPGLLSAPCLLCTLVAKPVLGDLQCRFCKTSIQMLLRNSRQQSNLQKVFLFGRKKEARWKEYGPACQKRLTSPRILYRRSYLETGKRYHSIFITVML